MTSRGRLLFILGVATAVSDRRLLFFIGPNKNGTRSWAELLRLAFGLRVMHDAGAWSRASRAHDQTFFADDENDAFTDGENFDVAWLMVNFPRAKFCFNTRPLLPWLVSRHFHAQDSTHAFLAGHVKSLALHNDDSTVACWVIQRDASLRRAEELLAKRERLAVLDITSADSEPAAFFAALAPMLPRQPTAGSRSIPHRGVSHSASLPEVRPPPRPHACGDDWIMHRMVWPSPCIF